MGKEEKAEKAAHRATEKQKKANAKSEKKADKARIKAEKKARKARKPKKRLGDRYDGRRVRSLPPMMYIVPFIMKDRNDATNLFKSRIDMDVIDAYLREKRKTVPGISFMHVFIAAYVRTISQKPALNRFISGQRIYKRDEIILSMVVKKSLDLNAQESVIKAFFYPEYTIDQVYKEMEGKIAVAVKEGDTNHFDRVARSLFALPAVVFKGLVGFLKFLDYFGLLPKTIELASPFHGTVFLSNLGSLGMSPIYHHLYNFGNMPMFFTTGSKYYEKHPDGNGGEKVRKYLDYTIEMDERITDGHYYSSAFKVLDYYLKHPYELEVPPDTVVEDVD